MEKGSTLDVNEKPILVVESLDGRINTMQPKKVFVLQHQDQPQITRNQRQDVIESDGRRKGPGSGQRGPVYRGSNPVLLRKRS